jgi:ABC-type sugar transport system ATPase subunit
VLHLADRVIVVRRGAIAEPPLNSSRAEIGAMMLASEREQ